MLDLRNWVKTRLRLCIIKIVLLGAIIILCGYGCSDNNGGTSSTSGSDIVLAESRFGTSIIAEDSIYHPTQRRSARKRVFSIR